MHESHTPSSPFPLNRKVEWMIFQNDQSSAAWVHVSSGLWWLPLSKSAGDCLLQSYCCWCQWLSQCQHPILFLSGSRTWWGQTAILPSAIFRWLWSTQKQSSLTRYWIISMSTIVHQWSQLNHFGLLCRKCLPQSFQMMCRWVLSVLVVFLISDTFVLGFIPYFYASITPPPAFANSPMQWTSAQYWWLHRTPMEELNCCRLPCMSRAGVECRFGRFE